MDDIKSLLEQLKQYTRLLWKFNILWSKKNVIMKTWIAHDKWIMKNPFIML